MDNFNDYIHYNIDDITHISRHTYDCNIGSSSVVFSFDYGSLIQEVCFARLYRQMREKTFSSNYLLRLPYKISDSVKELHTYKVDYPSVINELANMISSIYKLSIYNTPCNNIKLVTLESKLELCRELDYAATLIIFCLLRGMEGEYNYTWIHEIKEVPKTMKEYFSLMIQNTRGSHHNINDNIDALFRVRDPAFTPLKNIINNLFLDIMNKTFGDNGLIMHKDYQKYFTTYWKDKVAGEGNVMQTTCFEYIQLTTNKILRESIE